MSHKIWRESIRLFFSYKDGEIKPISKKNLKMISPSSDPFDVGIKSGFRYELRDQNGNLLYLRMIGNPVKLDYEVFTEERENPIKREKIDNPMGTFDLLIPNIPEAKKLTLYSSPLKFELQNNEMKSILEIELDDNSFGDNT